MRAFTCLCFAFLGSAVTAGPLALSIAVEPALTKAGASPAFVVSVVNRSTASIQLLDFTARPDLQPAYLPIRIMDGTRPADIPRYIADPGPIAQKDYRQILPGQTATFRIASIPFALNLLPPGSYTAVVEYRDPFVAPASAPDQASARFQVVR